MPFGPRDIDNNQVNPIATINRNSIGKHHIILNTLWIANVFPKLPHDSTRIANSLNFEKRPGMALLPPERFSLLPYLQMQNTSPIHHREGRPKLP